MLYNIARRLTAQRRHPLEVEGILNLADAAEQDYQNRHVEEIE